MNLKVVKIKSYLLRKIQYLLNPPILEVDDLIKGRNVIIEPGVFAKCKRMVLGDGVIIRANTRIYMEDLVIGDYTKINHNCLFTGTDWCKIGHNCWFGHYTLVDSIGTTRIGNGVCVSAHSQLWSHLYFGDLLEGCRFGSHKPLIIEDDVWFAGHCIVSPINAKKRTMALTGSVITKDMSDENHVYAGVPAKDVTEKFGTQFNEVSIDEKYSKLKHYLQQFLSEYKPARNRIRIVKEIAPDLSHFSQFCVSNRLYTKKYFPEEIKFMRFLNPTKAKFFPIKSRDWVRKYLDE